MADSGVEVARAYIALTTKLDLKSGVDEQLGEVEGKADSSGRKSGKAWGLALAAGMAAAIAAVAAAGKALYDIGGQFDDVSDTIRVGTGAQGEALLALEEIAKQVGATIPTSFSAAGETVADLNTRMGLTGDTLQTVASQYLEAGRLLGEEIDIGTTTGLFNQFQIGADGVSEAMDYLFQVSQSTGIGFNELASTVGRAGPLVQTLGFSFEDTAALVGALDKAGIEASGTLGKLAPALVRMAEDGEQPAEVFPRVISELQSFIDAGDDAAALNLAESVFGSHGASQFLGALRSGVVNLDDLQTGLGLTGDTILGLGAETADAAESWQILKNNALLALEPLGSAVFNQVGDVLGMIAESMQDVDFEAVFGPLGEALSTVLPTVIELWSQFSPFSVILQALQPVLPILADALQQVGAVLGEVLSAALQAAAPLIEAVALVAISLVEAALPLIPVVLGIVEAFLPLLVLLGELLGMILPPLVDLITGPLLEAALMPLMIAFTQLLPPILDVVTMLLDFLMPVIEAVVKTLGGLITFLTGVFTGDWEKAWTGIQDFFGGIWDGIVAILKGAVNLIIDLINGVIGGINDVASGISDATGGAISFSIPRIPRLAAGGIVEHVPGGVPAIIGEGRWDELVLPLSPQNLRRVAETAPPSIDEKSAWVKEGPVELDHSSMVELADILAPRLARAVVQQTRVSYRSE